MKKQSKPNSNNYRWVTPLAAWFAASQRPMPWRETRDPYRIWLSEIMLQQTQVATVIPYYERFLKRFPTLHALAAAPLDDVLKLWAGLGYYSRARNLHRGAQTVVERFNGRVPETPDDILAIPGIGAYTAGAILSIAYRQSEALVDGNVARVLARLQLLEGDWRAGEGKRATWDAARAAVAAATAAGIDPGAFNQALMELGATICSPRAPKCALCPVAAACRARAKNVQEDYPQLKVKAASPEWRLRAWLVRDGAKILFAQRAPEGLFGGLWEFPTERLEADADPARKPIARIKHVLTHRVLKFEVCESERGAWRGRCKQDADFPCWSGAYSRFKWLLHDDLLAGRIALSSAQAKILALCTEKNPLFD